MASLAEAAVGVSGYVESLKRDRDRFVRLAFCAADLLLEIDESFVIRFAAGASQSLIGVAPESLLGKSLLEFVASDDAPFITELLKGLAPGSRVDPKTLRLKRLTGVTPALSLTGYRLPEASGHFLFALRMGAAPVVPESSAEQQVDPQSGLLRKEAFVEAAGKHIRAAGERNNPLKLTLVHTGDLAGMRSRVGAGDADNVVRMMGACLKASAEGGEAAGQLQEGTFGFLHKPDLDVDKITGRIEQILRAADPTGPAALVNASTVNADIATISEQDSARVLLYTLDRFCRSYETGGTFEMSSLAENLKQMTRETTQMLNELHVVMTEGKFDIAFQPIVSLETGAIHHYEALTRFDKNLARSPYELLTFAENTGIITEFDLAMTKRALEWLSAQNKKGARHVLGVNLSGRSVANTGLVAALSELLRQSDVPPSQLIFEITESFHIEDLDGTNRFIQSLRQSGHAVCLDDFGAGSAALRYLYALEVDIVKIDGHYVRNAMQTARNQSFLKAVAGLCHDLGIATIAECVEDEASAAMLRDCHIQFGQGYLFGKPAFDVAAFLPAPQTGAPPMPRRLGRGGAPGPTRTILKRPKLKH